jgi:hypothetical protein
MSRAIRLILPLAISVYLNPGCDLGLPLPSYVENARYEGKRAWIIECTYGLGETSLGHFRTHVMDADTCSRIYFVTCR